MAVISERYLACSGLLVPPEGGSKGHFGIAGNLHWGIVAFGAKFVGEDRNVLGGSPDPVQRGGRKSVPSISASNA